MAPNVIEDKRITLTATTNTTTVTTTTTTKDLGCNPSASSSSLPCFDSPLSSKQRSTERAGSSLTASTADCSESSEGSLPSPGTSPKEATTTPAAVAKIDLSETTQKGKLLAVETSGTGEMAATAAAVSAAGDDDASYASSGGSVLSYVGEMPFGQNQFSGFNGSYDKDDHCYDENENDLGIDDVFAAAATNTKTTRTAPDFTCSFSARGVPRRNYKKTSSLDDSVRQSTIRGVPRRDSLSDYAVKYGYGEASPDDKQSKVPLGVKNNASSFSSSPPTGAVAAVGTNLDISTRSMPGLDTSSRNSYFGTNEQDFDASSRSVPSRGVSRRSSMKKHDKSSAQQDKRRSTIQFGGEIQIFLPGKNTPVVKRRSISFNKNVVIRPIAPAIELADKPDELWVQSEELKRIHQISMDLIASRGLVLFDDNGELIQQRQQPQPVVDDDDNNHNNKDYNGTRKNANSTGDYDENGNDPPCHDHDDDDDDEDCIRGLESLLEADLKLERKYDAWDSVLNEQDLQRSTGTFDDDDIAHAYKYSTFESSQEALERAKRDEDEVRLYLRGTRYEHRRSSM